MPSEEWPVELLQGSLDLIVLRMLATMGPLHAYAIATRLEQISDYPLDLNQGRLHPALVRLEQKEVRPNGVIAFFQVQAGEFAMGSATGNDDEKPIHRVRISQPFEIGKYEITQRERQMVMGRNPSLFKGAERPVQECNLGGVSAIHCTIEPAWRRIPLPTADRGRVGVRLSGRFER